jgi:hypothetical protein
MSHTDLIEVTYDSFLKGGKIRNRDAVCVKFGDKYVWISDIHWSFAYYNKDRGKRTFRIQQWIVSANKLENFVYKGKGEHE